MYQWWVFLHLLGVFGFLVAHGVSVAVTFRVRSERDPARVEALLQISSASISAFYVSLGVLLVGGIVAAFDGNLWGYGWIWASLVTLTVVLVAMYVMARPYYRRIRFVASAMAQGSQAVSPEQFVGMLRSRRPLTIAAIGFTGLVVILYLMLFKPTLGLSPQQEETASLATTTSVALGATELAFTSDSLFVPADKPFALEFENRSSVPHNVSVYDGDVALFTGDVFSGPKTVSYTLPALAPGDYAFVCDVHPEQMTGTVVAR